MTYESDIRRINQKFRAWLKNHPRPTEEDLKDWLKYAYIEGRKIE